MTDLSFARFGVLQFPNRNCCARNKSGGAKIQSNKPGQFSRITRVGNPQLVSDGPHSRKSIERSKNACCYRQPNFWKTIWNEYENKKNRQTNKAGGFYAQNSKKFGKSHHDAPQRHNARNLTCRAASGNLSVQSQKTAAGFGRPSLLWRSKSRALVCGFAMSGRSGIPYGMPVPQGRSTNLLLPGHLLGRGPGFNANLWRAA